MLRFWIWGRVRGHCASALGHGFDTLMTFIYTPTQAHISGSCQVTPNVSVYVSFQFRQVSVDMGAAWIHGTIKNPIAALCEKFSLGLFNTGSPTVMVDHDGR